jgi:Domain of Unknown Function with PDB structure (DUF3857)
MSTRHLKLWVSAVVMTLATAALCPPALWAGAGFQPVNPDELKMTSEPLAPGAPAIILRREVDRDDRGLTAHEDDYFRIKILTDEGRKYADIEIPFFKDQATVVNVHARTIRPDSSIVNFGGQVFEKSIVKTKGVRYLAKTFTLPEVQAGTIIEYYFTTDFSETSVFDSHWILSNELFTRSAKFSLHTYVSDYIPVSVRWSWQGLPPGTAQPKEGPDHVIRLEASNIPAFQSEDYMPPENELKSRVDFIYSDETPERELDKFWKKFGKKKNDQLESFIGKRKAMEQALSEIVAPSDSPDVKLQKIYARVQKIRNTSYEVEKTEQEQKREKEKDPENVEVLWKKQYANGRDLTWLYLALVRAAGFEAYGMWVADRRNYFFSPQVMDAHKLDANVVVVKINGKDTFFDPGAEFIPFGMLPWVETAVKGLRLDKDGGTWVQTELPDSAKSGIERKSQLQLSNIGDLEGKLILTYSGLEAADRRVEERLVDDAERKKFLEDEVKQCVPVASEVELTNQPEWKSSAPSLVAEFSVKVPGWVSSAGRRALLPVGLFSAPEKHLFDHADRVHAVYFEYPFQLVDDVSIEMPLGWQISTLPPAQKQDAKVVKYSLHAENDKGTLHLNRALNVDILLLDAKYYGALRNFFQIVRTSDEQQVILLPGPSVTGN